MFPFHINAKTVLVIRIFQLQIEEKQLVLDKFPEGIDTMAPLDEFEDIQSVSELKYNKLVSLKLSPNETTKSVNSTEKK